MYEILSLAARYFFAVLMVLIVLRAWRITVRDNRRAKVLREGSIETGCVGQWVVGNNSRSPLLVPILREGVLGASGRADMRIKGRDILPQHAHIEARQGGLLIRPIGKAKVAFAKDGTTGAQLFAKDGDILTIGKLNVMIVLFDPGAAQPTQTPPAKATPTITPPAKHDDFFDEDELWLEKPAKSTKQS